MQEEEHREGGKQRYRKEGVIGEAVRACEGRREASRKGGKGAIECGRVTREKSKRRGGGKS